MKDTDIRGLFAFLAERRELDPRSARRVLHNVIDTLRGGRREAAAPTPQKADHPS